MTEIELESRPHDATRLLLVGVDSRGGNFSLIRTATHIAKSVPKTEADVRAWADLKPHAVLIDWSSLSPELRGVPCCESFRQAMPDTVLIAVVSAAAVQDRVDALAAGVDDCVSQDLDSRELDARIRAAARRATRGSPDPRRIAERSGALSTIFGLSPREQQTLDLLVQGTNPKEIASQLGCEYSTVRTHLRRLCRKLGCGGTREAIVKFFAVS